MDFARDAINTLRSAAFPVFAVRPSQWPGDVMVGGVSGERKHPLSIRMRYDDDLLVEHPSRRIQIISTGLDGLTNRAPFDSFLLWEHSYLTEILNFVNNISRTPLPQDPHGVPMPGARRPLPTVSFRDQLFLESVVFDDHPALRLYRVQTPQAEILFMGWNFEEEALVDFARKARAIQEDETLFKEIEEAEYSAWEKIRQRKDQQREE